MESSEEEPYICDTCYLVFESEALCKSHSVACRQNKPYVCQTCHLVFEEESQLDEHNVIFHAVVNSKCDERETQNQEENTVTDSGDGTELDEEENAPEGEISASSTLLEKTFSSSCQSAEENFDKNTFENAIANESAREGDSVTLPQLPVGNVLVSVSQSANEPKEILEEAIWRPYECEICGKGLSSNKGLKAHLQTHNDEKNFHCDYCEKSFKTKSSCREHQFVHSEEQRFECNLCNAVFNRKSSLGQHMSIHGVEKPHKCAQCDKSYHRRESLREHMVIHGAKAAHNCPHCGKGFTRPSKLMEHMRVHSSKNQSTCIRVQSSGENPPSAEKQFECSHCDKIFSRRSSLIEHLTVHVNDSMKLHKCTQCDKAFIQLSKLVAHMRVHNGETPRGGEKQCCFQCDEVFDCRSNSLLEHLAMHAAEKLHKCTRCGKGFLRQSELIAHMTIHSGEKPHQCGQCRMVFAKGSDLDAHTCTLKDKKSVAGHSYVSHMLEHNSTELSNDSSNKSFGVKLVSILRNDISHQSKHLAAQSAKKQYDYAPWNRSYSTPSVVALMRDPSGENPYKCDACDEVFLTGSDFDAHMTTHNDNKTHNGQPKENPEEAICRSYECEICGKGLATKKALESHLQTHGQLKCKHCGKSFMWKNYLLHMREQNACSEEACALKQITMRANDAQQSKLIAVKKEPVEEPKNVQGSEMLRNRNSLKETAGLPQQTFNNSVDKLLKVQNVKGMVRYLIVKKDNVKQETEKVKGRVTYVVVKQDNASKLEPQKVKQVRHVVLKRNKCYVCEKEFATTSEFSRHMSTHKSADVPLKQNIRVQAIADNSSSVSTSTLEGSSVLKETLIKKEPEDNAFTDVPLPPMVEEAEVSVLESDEGKMPQAVPTQMSEASNRSKEAIITIEPKDNALLQRSSKEPEDNAFTDVPMTAIEAETEDHALEPHDGQTYRSVPTPAIEASNKSMEPIITIEPKDKSMPAMEEETEDHVLDLHDGQTPQSEPTPVTEASNLPKEPVIVVEPKDNVLTNALTPTIEEEAEDDALESLNEQTGDCVSAQMNETPNLPKDPIIIIQPQEPEENVEELYDRQAYQCDLLQGSLSLKPASEAQMLTPTDERIHQCDQGGKSFGQQIDFEKSRVVHREEKSYKCPLCQKCCTNNADLLKHIVTHSDMLHCCGVCDKSFIHKCSLIQHKRIHSGEKTHACKECGRAFDTEMQLRIHLNVHEKPYVCNECGKTFTSQIQLHGHLRIHTGENPYKCEVCNKTFSGSNSLRQHRWRNHNDKRFKCDQCEKGFAFARDLDMHLLTHNGGNPYQCEVCNKSFKWSDSLRKHKWRNHSEKRFKCDQCEKRYASNEDLQKHLPVHSGEKSYECAPCGKAYQEEFRLITHMTTVHGEKTEDKPEHKIVHLDGHLKILVTPFQCEVCGKAFTSNNNLGQHKRRNHSVQKRFKCDRCEKRYATSGDLQKHLPSHSGEKTYECTPCGKAYKEEFHLITHMTTMHDEETEQKPEQEIEHMQGNLKIHTGENPYQCEVCSKAFTSKDNLGQHKRRNHSVQKRFKCDQCEKRFVTRKDRQKHLPSHSGEKTYECSPCGRAYQEQAYLTAHITKSHAGKTEVKPELKVEDMEENVQERNDERSDFYVKPKLKNVDMTCPKPVRGAYHPYQCNVCNKACGSNANLIVHKRRHLNIKPYQCDVCKKTFVTNSSLTVHMRIHTGEKPYQCDMCGRSFNQPGSLVMHKRTHTGEKPFQCDQCGMAFNQKTSLNNHMLSHDKSNPLQCKVCGKMIASKQGLTFHMRVHTGEKPYHCNICKKSFTAYPSLIVHKRLHSGDRPYKCDQCPKAYTHKPNLTVHMRKHHS